MQRPAKIHFMRGGPRVACGLKARNTRADTRIKAKVTCGNCKRVLAAEAKP